MVLQAHSVRCILVKAQALHWKMLDCNGSSSTLSVLFLGPLSRSCCQCSVTSSEPLSSPGLPLPLGTVSGCPLKALPALPVRSLSFESVFLFPITSLFSITIHFNNENIPLLNPTLGTGNRALSKLLAWAQLSSDCPQTVLAVCHPSLMCPSLTEQQSCELGARYAPPLCSFLQRDLVSRLKV